MTFTSGFDPKPECIRCGCLGCFGMSLRCGHSFRCARDPAIGKHRCASMWTPMLEAILLALAVGLIVLTVMSR